MKRGEEEKRRSEEDEVGRGGGEKQKKEALTRGGEVDLRRGRGKEERSREGKS